MAREPMRRGPVGKRFSANLRELRRAKGLEQTELSERLEALGHPISANSISRLEKGERRADVIDLLALAIALGVSPNRLLLTPSAGDARVQLTEELEVSENRAWRWATGESPLPLADPEEERQWSTQRVVQMGDFVEANRPHDPPNLTTMDEVYNVYRPQLAAVREALGRVAYEEGVPLRVVQSALCTDGPWSLSEDEETPS